MRSTTQTRRGLHGRRSRASHESGRQAHLLSRGVRRQVHGFVQKVLGEQSSWLHLNPN